MRLLPYTFSFLRPTVKGNASIHWENIFFQLIELREHLADWEKVSFNEKKNSFGRAEKKH